MKSQSRLLQESMLPATLWERATGTLRLSPALAGVYCTLIDKLGLRTLAASRNSKNPPVGGLTRDKAHEHFAQQFDGSVARAQLALLDPKDELGGAADAYLISLAGNTLGFTDAPCGACAASLAFLVTVAELRAANVLPRHPLDVMLVAAEPSAHARTLGKDMLREVVAFLEPQGIFVTARFLDWDVTDSMSNTDLINKIRPPDGTDYARLLVVANFSAFLERSGKRKAAEPQLEELFRHASGRHCSVIWLEPPTNEVTNDGGLFPWLRKLVKGGWRRFSRERADESSPVATTAAHFHRALSPTERVAVRVAVLPIDLVRSS